MYWDDAEGHLSGWLFCFVGWGYLVAMPNIQKGLWPDIKRSPFFWYLLGLAFGAALTVSIIGRPDWQYSLATPEAANWAAAIGSLAAASVALWLGVRAEQRTTADKEARSRVAATVLLTPLLQALANAAAWKDHEAPVDDLTAAQSATFARSVLATDIAEWKLDKKIYRATNYMVDLPSEAVVFVTMVAEAYREAINAFKGATGSSNYPQVVGNYRVRLESLIDKTARLLWEIQHPGETFLTDRPRE